MGAAQREGPIGPDARILSTVEGMKTPWLTTLAETVTKLGEGWVLGFLTIIGALLLLRVDRRSAAFVASATLGAGVIHYLLKWLAARPRPNAQLIVHPGNYSFPSGHAMATVCFFVALALVVRQLDHRKQWLALIGALLIVAAVGATRVYLGVHYPSDVAGGWAVGAFWLAILYAWYRRAFLAPNDESETEPLS